MASIANNEPLPESLVQIAALIDEHKGEETVILDVRGECGFADFFIITTARSSRHLAGLTGYILDYLRTRKIFIVNKSPASEQTGWALIDCGNIIIHVMERPERAFYELEKLWFKSKTVFYSSKSS